MGSAAIVSSVLILLLPLPVLQASAVELEAPGYRVGDRWEYLVEGQMTNLLGFNESVGTVSVEGLASGEVTSMDGGFVDITWEGDLNLAGSLSFSIEGFVLEATITGEVSVVRVERYTNSYLLPLELDSSSAFELQISAASLSMGYSAVLSIRANQTPGQDSPQFPLQEGQLQFSLPTVMVTNTSFGFDEQTASQEVRTEFNSSLALEVAEGGEQEVPAGRFETVEVRLTTLEGTSLAGFQELFPGSVQVAYYATDVGSPVLLRYYLGGEEIGSASLRSFTKPGSPPFWQEPIFLVGLLIVPIGLMVYLYLRERKRGL